MDRAIWEDNPNLAERDKAYQQQFKQSNKKSTRRFKPVRFKDVEFVAASQDLIKGLFPKDGLIVVWGPPKCGKSFMIYDAAMHVARGITYRGRRVIQGVVVYIACEGERGLKARTEAYRQTLTASEDPPFYLLTTRLNLVADVDNLINDIKATLGDETPVIIVIDTLNRSLAGSENKPEDMTAYVQSADLIRQEFSGSSVVLIHHCGVNGDRPRGFTGLSAAADAQIRTERDAANNIVSTVEFMKDGEEGATITSRLHVLEIGFDEYGDIITSCVVEPVPEDTEKTRPTRRAKLSNKDTIALTTLQRALSAHGKTAPPHNYIKPGTIVVDMDLWRRFYLSGTNANGQCEDTRRAAWRRSSESLQSKKYIDIRDEMVWEL